METVKTLAEAVKDGTFDFEKRPINKKDKIILKRIASALPPTTINSVRRSIIGSKLKENGMTSMEGKDIEDDVQYTVFENKEVKINQFKKLKDAWKAYSSPVGIIFYGVSMFPKEESHNQWVEIINEYFGTNYPPLYLDDYFEDKGFDKQEG